MKIIHAMVNSDEDELPGSGLVEYSPDLNTEHLRSMNIEDVEKYL
jgi:hypothetical protein